MTRRDAPLLIALPLALVLACGERGEGPAEEVDADLRVVHVGDSPRERIDARCRLPVAPDTVRTEGAAVLLVWELRLEDVFDQPFLPADEGLLAYRAAIRADGADLRRPLADEPTPGTEEEAALWADERFNHELAQSGEAGSIAPITCLDAMLFAHQNARVPQLERPTEFLASVLTRVVDGSTELAIVFGAGDEMFPPKSVYGFDVVDAYRADGWRWAYALHNHTTQRKGERLALGAPALSTSDVQLARGLAAGRGLESARVTNGFYTFTIPAAELGLLKSR
jgi:hypothetical protein